MKVAAKAESSRTPTPFADVLIALAKHSKGPMPRKSKTVQPSSPAEMTAHITGAPLANTTFSKDPVIHAIQQHAADFRKWAFLHAPVATTDDLAAVSEAVQAAKVYRDGADAHRLAIVETPKRHLREIDKSFGVATKAFNEAIEHLQALAGTFAAARQQATQAALQAADLAFVEGRESDAIAALQTYNEVRADGVSDVEVVIEVEIVDPQAVPREYCSPDPELLRAAKLADPTFTCGGVTFTSTDRLLIRKKTVK